MNEEYQQIINECKKHLKRNVDLTRIRDLLVEQIFFNIISTGDDDYTKSMDADTFYDSLCSKDPYAFFKFIHILTKTGYIEEASLLIECYGSYTPHVYKMSSNPVGLCLIINNIKFKISRPRLESQLDVAALDSLFNSLGYKVTVKQNLTGQEMTNCLESFSKNSELANVDSIVVYILTHGDRSKNDIDILRGTDEKVVVLKNVYGMFNHDKCSMLLGKPKIFFFQSCRGEKGDKGYHRRESIGEPQSTDIDYTVHEDSDFSLIKIVHHPSITDTIVVHSTMPCQLSNTDKHLGSWLCQEVVRVFTMDHSRHDLDTMLKTVCKRMEDRTSEHKFKQTVHIELFGVSSIVKFGQGTKSLKRNPPIQGSSEPVTNPAKRQRFI